MMTNQENSAIACMFAGVNERTDDNLVLDLLKNLKGLVKSGTFDEALSEIADEVAKIALLHTPELADKWFDVLYEVSKRDAKSVLASLEVVFDNFGDKLDLIHSKVFESFSKTVFKIMDENPEIYSKELDDKLSVNKHSIETCDKEAILINDRLLDATFKFRQAFQRASTRNSKPDSYVIKARKFFKIGS